MFDNQALYKVLCHSRGLKLVKVFDYQTLYKNFCLIGEEF